MLRIALDRHHVNRLRLVRVYVNRKSKIGRQVPADLRPHLPRVVAAHHVPVLLHEQHVWPRLVHRDVVYAVTHLGFRIGNVLRLNPRLIGFQVSPPSSVRNAPAAEIAMKIRSGFLGSRMMVCRHIPPAPGCHFGPEPCLRNPGSSSQFCAPSVEIKAPHPRSPHTPYPDPSATAPDATPA